MQPIEEQYIDAAVRHAHIQWIPDDECYWASTMRPACGSIAGESPTHCQERLREFLRGWIRQALENGWRIPPIDGISLHPERRDGA